jgi:hypothetical protein
VTRGNYGTTSLAVGGGHGSISENMRLLFGNLAHGFVYAGLALAVAGLWWAWRHRRTEGAALLVAFAVAGPVLQAYTNTAYPDKVIQGVIARFYILPSIPVAIAAGLGAWWLLVQAERIQLPATPRFAIAVIAFALLAAPAGAALNHYSAQEQHRNDVAFNYGRDLLGALPGGALLLMRGDENLTSVSYAQNVEHYRTDVIALDTELLKLPSYVAQARKEHPGVLIPFTAYDGGRRTSLNAMVRANLGARPVYSVGVMQEPRFGKPFDQLIEGLASRWVRKGTAPDAYSVLAGEAERYAALHYPDRLYPQTSWEAAIGRGYAYAALSLGYAIQTDGDGKDVELAEDMYRRAILLLPTLAPAYKDLALLLHAHGGDPEEVAALWDEFLALRG